MNHPFGYDPFSDFPFPSSDPFAQMREMMMQPMMPPMGHHPQRQLSLTHPHSMLNSRSLMEPSMMMSPFGMFGGFHNMHQEMNNMMRNAQSAARGNPMPSAGSSYQSFTSISYGSGGGAQPHVYQSSSSTKLGPNGVRETRQTEKDSRSGVQKIQIGHHIGERGHIIGKSKNVRTGDQEETQEYVNIDEEQAPEFNQEWMQKAGSSGSASRSRRPAAIMPSHPYDKPHHHRHHHRLHPTDKDDQ